MRFLTVTLLALLVSACAVGSNDEAMLSAPPPAEGAGKVEGGIPVTENARVARAYLTRTEGYRPFQDNLPFGLILLRPGDTARNKAVCNSFVNNLQTPIDIIQADSEANIILTYWLLKDALSGADLTNCDKLLGKYDFARASTLRASYGRATASGPIFLALQLNEGLANPDGSPQAPYVALLDMSAQNAAQVGVATITWFNQVVSPEADAAAGPAYQPEKRRGRGIFQKVLAIAKNLGGDIACAVLRKEAPASNVTFTEVAAFDPFLNKSVGTLRLFVRASGTIGLGAELIGDLLCKSPATAALPVVLTSGAQSGCVFPSAAASTA